MSGGDYATVHNLVRFGGSICASDICCALEYRQRSQSRLLHERREKPRRRRTLSGIGAIYLGKRITGSGPG